MKGYDLPALEVKNIARRDIYHLARGSKSSRRKVQLAFVRSSDCQLDNDDVLRDVDAK